MFAPLFCSPDLRLTIQLQYTLPRPPNQPQKRKRDAGDTGAGSEPALNVSLKNMKASGDVVTLDQQPLSTSVYDLKTAYSKETSTPIEKIKLLYAKKPVVDSKTLKDVLGPAAEKPPADIQFTVMVVGGVAGASIERVASPPAEAPGPEMMAQQKTASGEEVLRTEAFWEDLSGFLKQRTKDEEEGERLAGVFRVAWEKSSS
jgi:ubiquitin-like protein 4